MSEGLVPPWCWVSGCRALGAPGSSVGQEEPGQVLLEATCGIFLYYLGHGAGEVEVIRSSITSRWDLASLPKSLSLTGQGPSSRFLWPEETGPRT